MSDIDLQIALMESGRMNLMHLPAGAISWLWDRPTKQIDAAESLAVAANAHGNPVVDASLLKADQNILLIKCEGGECFRIYPDGGFSYNDSPMDIGGCSSVLQGMAQSECPMDDNGHQMAAVEDIGNDEHMDTVPPESGVASPQGMSNLAGEPTMVESGGLTGGPHDYISDQDVEFDDVTYNRMQGAGMGVSRDQTPQDRQSHIKSWLIGKLSEPTDRSALGLYRHALYRMKTAYDNAPALDDTNTKIKELVDIAIERMMWENSHSKDATPPRRWRPDWTLVRSTDDVDESYGDASGPGVSAMGGMGTGTPYVGDIAMDSDPEIENLVGSRELGEASIHMFRNETDDSLSALAEALGLTEMFDDMDVPTAGELAADEFDEASNIKLEVYDDSTDSYQEFPVAIEWHVEPTEYDGQYVSSQGGASVEKMELDKPIQVNGKVYREIDEELAALVLATYNIQPRAGMSAEAMLADYIADQQGDHVEIPQHHYPDSTR